MESRNQDFKGGILDTQAKTKSTQGTQSVWGARGT